MAPAMALAIARFIDQQPEFLYVAPAKVLDTAGLYALSLGLSQNLTDGHTMRAHGMVMYDALCTWCRSCQGETHAWPPKVS